ncbi:hypothetical protein EC957_002769 [Mortierella hygrophila]|uniref:Uncharacterized protein n=1 Tax=Mortierella hygrophila TaxID=979708 RepID=A0A9P6F3U1_9FUNG|nr:hypothetical protein EC957_002769 [Mortierella hygrophila]
MEPELTLVPELPVPVTIDKETQAKMIEEDLDIREPLTRECVEQTIPTSFERLDASIAAMGEPQCDLDNDLDVRPDPVKLELLKLEERAFGGGRVHLEHLNKTIGVNHDEIVRFRIRNLLARDEYIIAATKCYDIAPNDKIKDIIETDLHRVQFTFKLTEFQAWREYHARVIGAALDFQRDYVSKRNGLQTYTYFSQCHDPKQRRQDKVRGGISGQARAFQKASIKRFCPTKIVATEALKGIKTRALVIDLYNHHAHELASLENIGTRQRLDRIKATIKSLLLQGSSIKNVMERLTMKYVRFMEVIRRNGQRLSQDDFITYEDVYNIWYNINNEMTRTDPDLDLLALAPQFDHGQQVLQQDLQEEEPVPEHGLSYYLDRIISLETLRDKSQTIPHESQLCALLDRFLAIYEPSLSRKEVEDLGNKRQRQCY